MSFLTRSPILICLALAFGSGTAHSAGLVQLPRTGQTVIHAAGDDGDIQAGVAWPGPRFTVNQDCATDNLTGLMWGRLSASPRSWAEALIYPRSIIICGLMDWRLPNINELESLVHAGEISPAGWLNTQGFNVASGLYWSSTSVVSDPTLAWGLDLQGGATGLYPKSNSSVYLTLAVRTSIPGPARVWQTGQTQCYDSAGLQLANCAGTGQDGDYRAGTAWPVPRFSVSADCVTDNLTGLTWAKAPDSTLRTWQEALTHSNGRSLCGHDDWRLPNKKEMSSLKNYEPADNGAWLVGQGFSGVLDIYWSSTTYADQANDKAWTVNVNGSPGGHIKSAGYYAWPVRGGDLYPPSDAFPPVGLPKTGQTVCSDAGGTAISCKNTGQDGDILAGIAWPEPRFTANGNCVTDNLTGLVWTRDAHLGGMRTWQGALDGIVQLNGIGWCGQTDWRLSNVNELQSLVHAGEPNPSTWLAAQGFTNVQASYWTSTTFATSSSYAWIVKMDTGQVFGYLDDSINKNSFFYVWPVRGRNTGPAKVWKTGQTTSYAIGDDGDLERGVAWPSRRFTYDASCVVDHLTNLMWARFPSGTPRTWQDALTYANGLSLCGYGDWRVPNSTEMRSLVNYEYAPAGWLNDPANGFYGIGSGAYWTSTTNAVSSAFAWFVAMDDGRLNFFSKTANATLVFPVRGGSVPQSLYLPIICR